MKHKPQLEAYNSTLFYKANLKCIRVIIKHRHDLFNVSRIKIYFTIGACGADTSTLLIAAFSGNAIIAL